MRKITVASALCFASILAACGGGGSDGDAAGSASTPSSKGNVSGGGSSNGGASGTVTNADNGAGSNSGAGGTSGSSTGGTGATGTGTGASGSTTGTGGSGSTTGSGSQGSGGATGGSSGGSSDGASGGASGGSSSGSSGGSTGGSSDDAPGGTSGGTGNNTPGGGATADIGNTIPVVVSSASTVRNYPLVSVTVCQPNSTARTSCATVNNVLLDTGSFGLRLYASAIPSATLAALPIQRDATSGTNVAACAAFGSGYTWGSLRNADVKLGGEVAAAVPIQVMSDPAIVSRAPSSCVWGASLASPAALGANGVLGVGVARNDCGVACAGPVPQTGYSGSYYADANPAAAIVMPVPNQVTNPVALFPIDNNGLIVSMPAVPAQGAVSATGTVTFGIDTQTNNALSGSGATVFNTDLYGNFTGSYNGASTIAAFIDSGTNALMFQDSTIPQANQFYAPVTALVRPLALSSSNGASAAVSLNIGNASTMLKSIYYAFNNLGAYMTQTIDLGMPFFYGRRVYYGIAGTRSTGGSGPYVGFTAAQ